MLLINGETCLHEYHAIISTIDVDQNGTSSSMLVCILAEILAAFKIIKSSRIPTRYFTKNHLIILVSSIAPFINLKNKQT